jgi:hypothetical protein
MPIILATQGAEIRRVKVQGQPRPRVHETLSRKTPSQKRAGRVAHMVEHLPRKCETLSSKPILTTHNKNPVC